MFVKIVYVHYRTIYNNILFYSLNYNVFFFFMLWNHVYRLKINWSEVNKSKNMFLEKQNTTPE
jgi:hypothetical protein